jgi:hypothetical protein
MREIDEIFIPLKKSHSGNVQRNMDDVVVLAFSSLRSDPIRSNAASGDASERCTRTAHRCLLPPCSSKYGGDIDWISSTTAWYLWWRISAAGLRLCAVARERCGGQQLGRRLGLGEEHTPALPSPLIRSRGSTKGAALASKSTRWPQGENLPPKFPLPWPIRKP